MNRAQQDCLRPNSHEGRLWQSRAAFQQSMRVRGFTLFELVMVILLMGVFSATLYKQVSNYQEQAELAAMRQTASAFQSGLQFRVAAYLLSRNGEDLAQLNSENPANWLSERPSNYAGAYYGEPPASVLPGDWYYDLQSRTMIYLVRLREHFDPGPDGYRIRFRAQVDYGPILGADGQPIGVMGVRTASFKPVHPYRWFE